MTRISKMENIFMSILCMAGAAVLVLGRQPHRSLTGEEINTKLKKYGVVPGIIDESKGFSQLVVAYNDKVFVDFGTKVTPKQIEEKPKLIWPVQGDGLYTLVFTDPDHPLKKREKAHEFVHWLVGNIPGTQVEKGNEIADYIGYRSFYEDEEPHRLLYLVYKQPNSNPIEFTETKLLTAQVVERGHGYNFTVKKFAEKYKLNGPVAVNLGFIECKEMWDGEKYTGKKTADVDLFPDAEDDIMKTMKQTN